MNMNIYLNTTLDNLQYWGLLTNRAVKALHMKGVRTVRELLDQRRKGRLSHLDPDVQTEIGDFVFKLRWGRYTFLLGNWYMNMEDEIMPPSPNTTVIDAQLQQTLNYGVFTVRAYESVSDLRRDVSKFLRELFPDAWKMADAILKKTYDVLTVHRDLGWMGNVELRRLLLHYLKVMRKYIFKAKSRDEKTLGTVEELIHILEANINTFDDEVAMHDLLSTRQRRELLHLFDTLSAGLSEEAVAIQRRYLPAFTDAMKLFGLPEFVLAERCDIGLDRPVLHEVWDFVQTLEDAFSEEAYSGKDVRLRAIIAWIFPWLSAADRRFVFRFHQDNDSMPLFYIMMQLLRNSSDTSIEIYALANGIKDGQKHALEDIAATKYLSRERMRQHFWKGHRVLTITIKRYIKWGDYASLLDSNYITALSPKYRMIQEGEQLPQDFDIFCALLSVFDDFKVIHIGEKEVAVHRRLRPYVHVNHIRNQLTRISHKQYRKDAVFELQSLVEDVPEDLREDAFWIVCQVAQAYSDIPFDEDWKVAIKQNYVDGPGEIYKILERKGKPMSLKAIFTQFKRNFPNHKFTEPEQLRTWISKHEHIKSIGMTRTYGLDKWKNVFYGNIRDLLRQTLEASSRPIHIDKLTTIVKRHFPTTNAKSISSSMAQEAAKDFVAFQGGFFGLSSKIYSSKYKTAEEERRYTFNERLRMLTQFIAAYHRFPFSRGGEAEQGLQRWLYNVENKLLDLTNSQRNRLKTALQPFRDSHFPENETEERFLETCEQYKAYIEKEYETPTRRSNTELYDWMKRAKENYNSYIDNRRYYLTELFNYIHSLGFDL